MSAAQAILTIVGPIGLFIASAATMVIKRVLRHFDVLEEQLKAESKLNAEIAVELRLAREDRENSQQEREQAKREREQLRADVATIKEVIKTEFADQRHAELRAQVELIAQRTSGNPPEPRKSHTGEDGPRTTRNRGVGG